MNKFEIKLFITFFILFSYFSQWNDIWDFNSSFDLTRAIVEENRIEIDSYHTNTQTKSYYQGHYYTPISPFLSFVTTWIYFIIKQFTTSIFTQEFLIVVFSNPIWGALSIILIYKLVGKFTKDEKIKLITTLSYGLGTSIFPYSLGFYIYPLAILLILVAFYLLLQEKLTITKNPKVFFLSGILSGLSYIIYPTSIFLSFLLFLYGFFINKRLICFFILGAFIGILPLICYNYVIFRKIEIYSFTIFPILFHVSGKEEFLISFTSFMPFLSFLQSRISFAYENFKILPRILFYPWNGVFFYYPILFLAFIGIMRMCWNRNLEGFVILFLFLFIWFYASIFRWWGDYSFGPRRFLLVIPFLILGLPSLINKISYKIVIPFFIWSCFVNLLSLQPWISLDVIPGINETYQEKIENFEIIRNPIFEDFLPTFLKGGPRSPLCENLILYQKICIRIDEETSYPPLILDKKFENKLKPFLCTIPIGIILSLLWSREIFSNVKNLKCRGWDLNPRRD